MLNINKKSALAVALAAGLGMTSTASAFTLLTDANATPVLVATADIISSTTDIGIDENFTVSLTGDDGILGRTTGFTIRYTLNNGATFGDPLTTADISVGPAAFGGDANNAWIPTIAAGGGLADNYVVILFSPPVAPVGTYALRTGILLDIADADAVVNPTLGDGQILDTVQALQTAGQQVVATVQFIDPVTANNIMTAQTLPILRSGDPVVLACDATDGDTAKTIDVGVTPAQAAKTFFSPDGTIGSPAQEGYMNMGSITVSIDPAFTSFAYAGTDEFVTTVSGDFSAFAGANGDVFLSSLADCSTTDVSGTISNANGTVVFDYIGSDMGNFSASGFTAFVCAEVIPGNAVVIDATNVVVSTVFTRGAVSSNSSSCPLLPLRYNGSVVDVYHINPAANPTAQSFVRVINPSDTGGTVTITGIDDNGVAAAAPITFVLASKRSIQINSEDLENGNVAKGLTGAWGDGAGKWRATVTGEFANMLVQGLNRNSTDGTVTNLTDADNQGEQVLNSLFNQGGL